MTTSTAVGKPSAAYLAALPAWQMVEALKGGTVAMRAAGATFLPQNVAELPKDYTARLLRSFLFAAYARTLELMVGKVFAKPVEPGGTVPKEIKEWLADVDLEGTDVHAFAARFCEAAFDEGLAHILVDLPNTQPLATLADERAVGVRPYWALIRASAVLGFRQVVENGRPILAQLRVAETGVEPDGEYGEKHVDRVRVYERDGTWTLWQAVQGAGTEQAKTYALVDNGRLSIGRIPLVTFYANRAGYMTGAPMLENLAWLNIEHWQKSSDQNNILHVARVPILFAKGVDTSAPLVVSSNSCITASDHNADLKYVEHTGAAIDAGQADLDALVDRMAALGVDMLIKKRPSGQAADATATGKAITEGGENSILGNLARNLKMTLDAALRLTAEWVNRDPETVGKIDMDTQLGVPVADKADVTELVKLRISGELSAETLFAELQRREFLDPSIEFEDERKRIETEGPPMGMQLGGADGQDDDGTDDNPAGATPPGSGAGRPRVPGFSGA